MIVKPSTKADECTALSEFMETPEFQKLPERARKDAMNRRRGLVGERSTAHILDRHFQNLPDHALLHDLRLPDGNGGFAQFDHVILSRHSRTASIVEVKNYSGRLSKNEHNEWIVWYQGRRQPRDIPNPIAQAQRQKAVLKAWLVANKHDVAFETIGAFVIIPPDCAIDRTKIGSEVPIYKADNFFAAWLEFGGITTLGKLFSSGVSAPLLKSIAVQLAADHQQDTSSIEKLSGGRAPASPTGIAGVEEEEPAAPLEKALVVRADEVTSTGVAQNAETVTPTTEEVPTLPPVKSEGGKGALAKVEVAPGIFERVLSDGRVAFLADDRDEAREVLSRACKGRARWNPRFRNWLIGADQAGLIREAIAQDYGSSILSHSTEGE